ncbi:MAG: glycosyltransferase family 4 protein [Planctomycetota bacterium]
MQRQRRLLIISQVFVPDPASVGQHLADVAAEMVRRGQDVTVITSARGYEDPSVRYPRRETWQGVEIIRLPFSSFGKRSLPIRLLGALSFLMQATVRGLLQRDVSHLLVSTSPPMATIVAIVLSALRRVPFTFWVMDVNPDQAIALGAVSKRSWPARLLEGLNRKALRRAENVVVLDRFMAERVRQKCDVPEMFVSPPWPHVDPGVAGEREGARRLREAWGLGDKTIFMHSGNHSPAHPLDRLLAAARSLEHRNDLVFLFVGGGLGKRDVEAAIEAGAHNVVSLPYQPLERLADSLAVADVHIVPFGDAMVGIVHPCKVYGAMAAARPILLIGPSACHVGELIEDHGIGWQVSHDAEALATRITEIADSVQTRPEELRRLGQRASEVIRHELTRERLCSHFCDILEGVAEESETEEAYEPTPELV